MRKFLAASVISVFLGLLASQALACGWDGPQEGHMGWHGGYSQGFLKETAPLRQDLAAKQGEYNALMAQPNPDQDKVAQLSREIVSLQYQLQNKTQGPMGPRAFGYGPDADGWTCW